MYVSPDFADIRTAIYIWTPLEYTHTGHILYLIVLLLCIKENVSIGKVKLESILDVAIISHAVNGNSMQDVCLKNAIIPYYIFQGR